MKQVVQNYRSGELKVDEVPPPVPKPGWVQVANHCSLISAGTERSTVTMAKKSLAGKAQARPDLVRKVVSQVQKEGLVDTARMVMGRLDTRAALGYSCAGVVVDVGAADCGFAVGDRVACAGQNYASHAELVNIPKNLCVKIPDTVSMEDAAYVALGSIALQGVRQADPKLGEIVAVVGLGLLGQLVVQLLKANGCTVIATDLEPGKLELATALGADHAVTGSNFTRTCEAATSGYGVDAVILTASSKSSEPVTMAGEVCRRKGRVVVVGATGMDIPREDYYAKELELRLSTSYGPGRYDPEYEEGGHDYPYGYVRWSEQRNMAAFLDLVAATSVNLKPLTTHRFDISEAEQAYELITSNSEPFIGICLQYADEGVSPARTNRVVISQNVKPVAAVELGIIGAGNHIRDMVLPRLKQHPSVNLRAVCSQTGISARTTAERHGANSCYTDYRELLADTSINTVVIGTRHDSHAEIVIASLQAGKHVLVEKPLCLSHEQLQQIDAAFASANQRQHTVLQVGFNRRYSSHTQFIRQQFLNRSDPLMMLYRVNAGAVPADHWIQDPTVGGGRIIGEACHFIDYMVAVSQSLPTAIHCQAIGQHSSRVTNDKAILNIHFEDGSIGTVFYAADGDKSLAKERFEAFADGRSVVLEDFVTTTAGYRGKCAKHTSRKRDKGFAGEVENFVDSIRRGDDPQPAYEQARAVTLTTLKAVESLRQGLPLPLD